MDDLYSLLAGQGYVTASDAHRLGYSAFALNREVGTGRLRHPLHGVYLAPDDMTPEAEHAALTRAVLAKDLFAVASHQSALALHGLPLHDVPTAPVHVADARAASRIHASVHRHVLRPGDRVVEVDGCRALTPALACVQVAARHGVAAGLVAMDAALRLGLASPQELESIVASGRVRRGAVRARTAVGLADARAESPGESLLRLALAGSPWQIEPQAELGDDRVTYRVDLLVDGRVAVEFDGATKYADAHGQAALIAEKRREDWLRARGLGVVRVIWAELAYPAALRRVVHQAVVEARTRRLAS